MDLKIINVKDIGDIDNERAVFKALNDSNLKNLMIADNTFDDEGEPSNKHRHLFKFPNKDVKKDDRIVVYSKEGNPKSRISKNKKCNLHFFYWNSEKTIWNKDGDKCHLIEIKNVKSKSIEAID